jgi:hypothetical protein
VTLYPAPAGIAASDRYAVTNENLRVAGKLVESAEDLNLQTNEFVRSLRIQTVPVKTIKE